MRLLDGTAPPLGARYWTALCVASLLGANLGDLIAHDLHLGHWLGVPPLLALLSGALLADRRTRLPARPFFWTAVVLVRTIATNLADLATHDWHLGQPALICGLAALLLCGAWLADSARTDARFWATLFVAGTLGTVLGDDASHLWGLPTASLLLGSALAVALCVAAGVGGRRADRYWTLVLLARTAGTSIADLSADKSGLGLAGSTLVMALLMAAAVFPLRSRREGRVPA